MGTSKKLQRRNKNREARRKVRKFKKRAPLHWVDKLIYIVLISLPIILAVGQLIYIGYVQALRYEQSTLIAVCQPHDNVGTAGSLLLLAASVLFAVGLEQRQPIFGIPGYPYGRVGGMKAEEIPLFSEGASFRKHLYGFFCILACLLVMASCFMVRYFLNDRWELHQSEIIRFDAQNQIEKSIPWSDIKGYSISTNATGGKNSHYELNVTLKTRGGEKLRMHLNAFRDFDTFQQTDSRLLRQGCAREVHVEDWIWRKLVRRQEFTKEEFQILSEMLELEFVGEGH